MASPAASRSTTEPVNLGSFQIYWHYGGLFLHDGSAGPASGAAGSFRLEGGPTSGGPWTTVLEDADPVTTAGASYPGDFDWTYVLDAAATYRYWRLTSTDVGANNDIYELKGFTPDTEGGIVSTSYRPKRINLNRNLRMGPDQASIELINETLPLGWGPTSIFPTNSRMPVYQWFGDVGERGAHVHRRHRQDQRQPRPADDALECRSMAGPILVDQTFSTTAPQGADEDGEGPDRGERRVPQPRGGLHRRATSSTAPAGRRPTSTSPTPRSSSTSSSSTTARAGGTRSRASWSSWRTTCGTTRTQSSTSSPSAALPASTTRSPPTTPTRSGSHDRQPARHVARLGDGPVRPPHARQGPRPVDDAQERLVRGVAHIEVPPARRPVVRRRPTRRTCASSTAARSGSTSSASPTA
jgi:hypothetical protein